MRVYYFTGADYALSNIALRRIKISRFSDLNDPFELLAVDLSNRDHRKVIRQTKENIDKDNGLICFCKSWENPLLWGHYAEKHSGICLGFDIPDEHLAMVTYRRTLMKIMVNPESNEPIFDKATTFKLLCTKFTDWAYEREYRLFVELDHATVESGKYFCSFSNNLLLSEVILGQRCEMPIASIRELVSGFDSPVNVLKARMSFSQFKMVKNARANK